MMIRKQLKLNKTEYFQTHLAIINCVLPIKLTPMEIKVLAAFMSFTGDIANDRFGSTAKKMVKAELNITSAGLSNYLKSLKEKTFLISKEDRYEILPILFPNFESQSYEFNLVNLK